MRSKIHAKNLDSVEIWKAGYVEGVKAVASFVGGWDDSIAHDFKFEDVILCKFNIRKKAPRRKRMKCQLPALVSVDGKLV